VARCELGSSHDPGPDLLDKLTTRGHPRLSPERLRREVGTVGPSDDCASANALLSAVSLTVVGQPLFWSNVTSSCHARSRRTDKDATVVRCRLGWSHDLRPDLPDKRPLGGHRHPVAVLLSTSGTAPGSAVLRRHPGVEEALVQVIAARRVPRQGERFARWSLCRKETVPGIVPAMGIKLERQRIPRKDASRGKCLRA
jgi:hypothetical protein